MKTKLFLTSLIALHLISSFAGTEPKFSLIPQTPTSITVPANRHVLVQYRVTNKTNIERTLTIVPIPNVRQRTDDPADCKIPFTLATNQSCNLTLSVSGATLNSSYFGGPIVCKTKANSNEPDPFLCSQPEASMVLSITPTSAVVPTAHKLFVSNWSGNSISLCYINNVGNLEHCLITATSSTFVNPEALAISNNTLYVANIGGSISSCAIDQVSGELSQCQSATSAPDAATIYGPDGIVIANNTAYISNSGPESFKQGVTTCTVNSPLLTGCIFTQGDASFSVPSDIALTDGFLYITNFNSQTLQTTYCNSSTNPLCTAGNEGTVIGTTNLLNQPEGLIFAVLAGSKYAYFTNNGNNTVTLCQVNFPTVFTNCAVTEGFFTGFGNLAILTSSLKAYLPSGLKTIAICDVSEANGSLSNCVNSSETNFNNPSGLFIL